MDDHPNTLTVLENGKTSDITSKELQQIEKYKEAGLPGVTSISDVGVAKAIDMYMGGKTYHEIAKVLSIKKDIILYLGYKFNWYGTKMEHLEILDANLKERILQANLVNQDFMLQIQEFFKQKIGTKMSRYFATGDDDVAKMVDRKDIEMYYKAVELLSKLTTDKPPQGQRNPTVGLNLGDGVSVKKVGDNEVIITPKARTVGEMLNELANLKRKEEGSANKKDTYDIIVEESKNTQEED